MYQEAFSYIKKIFTINILFILVLYYVSFTTNSIAILAFTIDKTLDTISNIVSIIGVGKAVKSADTDHQYGHAKYEVISRFILSLLLFFSVIQIEINAINRLIKRSITPEINSDIIAVMILVDLGIFLIFLYTRRSGKKTGVKTLIAESYNYLFDVASLSIVITGVYFSTLGYPFLDPILAIIISLIILKLGWEIFKESVGILTDKAVVDAETIKKLVESFPGVIDCHNIASRSDGYHSYLEFHMVVNSNMTVEEAHSIADAIEEAIKRKFKEYNFKQITIHIEPESVLEKMMKN
ncbi:MAG: cation diffusion facilitator family transporter [Candidatus Njordarchaeia archaeon]